MDVNAKFINMYEVEQFLNMKGWKSYCNKKESWRLGKMSSNPDIIVVNKNHHNWFEIKDITAYFTPLSDHKLFEINV